jgi:hypothetical protein
VPLPGQHQLGAVCAQVGAEEPAEEVLRRILAHQAGLLDS